MRLKIIQKLSRLLSVQRGKEYLKSGAFLHAWMEMPYHWRKSLSHTGGVRRRELLRPRHELKWHPYGASRSRTQKTFDPGNKVYAFALRLLWNHIYEQSGWNEVTRGGIFESIFAYVNLKNKKPDGRVGRDSSWTEAAEFIDESCYCTWMFMLLHADEAIWQNFSIFRDKILQELIQHDESQYLRAMTHSVSGMQLPDFVQELIQHDESQCLRAMTHSVSGMQLPDFV